MGLDHVNEYPSRLRLSNFTFPLLLFPHGLMLFITIRIAPKRIILNIIGMALTFIPAMAQFPFAQSIQTPESPVRVASYNVRAFYQGEDAASNIGLWAVKEAIDVLCAQEIRNPGFEHIKSQFTYTTLMMMRTNFPSESFLTPHNTPRTTYIFFARRRRIPETQRRLC